PPMGARERRGRLRCLASFTAALSVFVATVSPSVAFAQPAQPPLIRPGARPATNEPVRVEITIPPAQTYVLGDPTPLVWRFTNASTQTLAFMWEGCCRNNGKVEMKRHGPPPPVTGIVPSHTGFGSGIYNPKCDHCKQTRKLGELTVEAAPAGPSLAHQFARAVRLAPGGTQEFSTLLADWVKAEFTGDYQLRAQYLGVAPAQRPQMPRGATLWNGRTTSAALEISLLSVADYLAERPAREGARQLRLTLTGPAKLIPFSSTPLKLRLTNLGAKEQTLDWPACLDLWLVATNGTRAGPAAAPQFGTPETLRIPGGSSVEREVPFNHELLVGEPLGSYQAFIDLREVPNAPRVPSNAIALTWRLDRDLVTQLLRAAADQPRDGARNAPLKLVRLYLGDLATPLGAVDPAELSSSAAKLTADLRTAAALKPLSPRPGRVDLSLSIAPDGKFQFNDAALVTAFAGRGLTVAEQFGQVIAVRRHLGWDVAVSLKPEPATPLHHVATALAAIAPLHASLDYAPTTTLFNADSTAYSAVTFPPTVIPANLVLRATKSAAAARLAFARHLPDPQRPGVELKFTPEEIANAKFTPLANTADLEKLLADGQLPTPRVLVLAAPQLIWTELNAALAPLLNRGMEFDLVIQ
ncbi:MAG: hypothetical protein ACKODH_02450, partial [Limisphaerales bacterium]